MGNSSNSYFSSSSYYEESRTWLFLGLPAACRSVAELLPWLVTLTFIGHYSSEALAALSLIETYMYGLMVIVWTGIHLTANTLISQAHGNRSIVAIRSWGIMSFIAMFILSIITVFLWIGSAKILKLLQFDANLVDTGYIYALYAIPNLFFEAIAIPCAAYITAIQRPDIPFYIQLIGALLDILVTYILVFPYNYGLKGAAIGWTAGSGLTVILYGCIFPWLMKNQRETAFGHEEENILPNLDNDHDTSKQELFMDPLLNDSPMNSTTIHTQTTENTETSLWSKAFQRCRTFSYWKTFWIQALPNLVTTALSQWQLQTLSFLAAKFGSIIIAAHNTSICLFEVLLTFSQGLGEATAVRIGHHLGNKDINAAKQTMKLSLGCISIISLGISGIGYLCRSNMGKIFTNDPAVLETIEEIAPFFWIGYFVLSIGMWATAVLEGQGRATAQTVCFLIGGWGVMVPLGFTAFNLEANWQLRGLWGALLIGYTVVTSIASIFVYFSKWEQLVEDAQHHHDEDKHESKDLETENNEIHEILLK